MTKTIDNREAAILTEIQQLKDLKTDAQKQAAKTNYLKLSQAYAHLHMDPHLLKDWAVANSQNTNIFTSGGKQYYVYGLNFITGSRAKYEARLNSLKNGKEFATKLLLDLTQYETKLMTIATYYQNGNKEIKQSHADAIKVIKKSIDGKIWWADWLMSHMDSASRAQYNAFKARYFGEILTGMDPKYMIVPKALESKKQASTLWITHEVIDPAKDAANFSASKADWMIKQWMNGWPAAALTSLKNLHAKLDNTERYTDAQVRNIQVYTQALHRSMANILSTQLSQAKNQWAVESAQKHIIQFAALITGKTAWDDFSTKVQSWLSTNGVDDRFIDEATASSVLKQALMKNSVESMGDEVAQEVHTELQSDAREAVSKLKTTKLTVDPITGQTSNQSVYDFIIAHRLCTNLPWALTASYDKKWSDRIRWDLSIAIFLNEYVTNEASQGVSVPQIIRELMLNQSQLRCNKNGDAMAQLQAQSIVDAKVDDILWWWSAKKKFFTSEYWTGKNIAWLTGQQKQIYNLYKDIAGAWVFGISTGTVKMSQEMAKWALPTLIAIPLIATWFGAPAGVALIGGTIVGTSAYWATDGRSYNSTKEMLIDRWSEMWLNVATAWWWAKLSKYGVKAAEKYLTQASKIAKPPVALITIPVSKSKITTSAASSFAKAWEEARLALMTSKGIKPIGWVKSYGQVIGWQFGDGMLGMWAEVLRQNILLDNEQSFSDVLASPQGMIMAWMMLWWGIMWWDMKHIMVKRNVMQLDWYIKAHPEARNMIIDLQDGHYTTLGRVHDQILKPAMEGKFTDSQWYVRLPDQVTSEFAAGVQEYGKLGIKARKNTTDINLVKSKKTIRAEVVDNASLTRDAKLAKLESELKSQWLLTESLTTDQKGLLREIEDVGWDIYMLTAEQRAQKLALAQSDRAKTLFGTDIDKVMRYAMDEGYLGLTTNDLSLLQNRLSAIQWQIINIQTINNLNQLERDLISLENDFNNRNGDPTIQQDLNLKRSIEATRALYDTEVQRRWWNQNNQQWNQPHWWNNGWNINNVWNINSPNNITSMIDGLFQSQQNFTTEWELKNFKKQLDRIDKLIENNRPIAWWNGSNSIPAEQISDITTSRFADLWIRYSQALTRFTDGQLWSYINTISTTTNRIKQDLVNQFWSSHIVAIDFTKQTNGIMNYDLIDWVSVPDAAMKDQLSSLVSNYKQLQTSFGSDLDSSFEPKVKEAKELLKYILQLDNHKIAAAEYKKMHEFLSNPRWWNWWLPTPWQVKDYTAWPQKWVVSASYNDWFIKAFDDFIAKKSEEVGWETMLAVDPAFNYAAVKAWIKWRFEDYMVWCARAKIEWYYIDGNKISFEPDPTKSKTDPRNIRHQLAWKKSLLEQLKDNVSIDDKSQAQKILAEIEEEQGKLDGIWKKPKIEDLVLEAKSILSYGKFDILYGDFVDLKSTRLSNDQKKNQYRKIWLKMAAERERILFRVSNDEAWKLIIDQIGKKMDDMAKYHKETLQTTGERLFTWDYAMSRQVMKAYEDLKTQGHYIPEMDEFYNRAKGIIDPLWSKWWDIMQYEKLDRISKLSEAWFDNLKAPQMWDLMSRSIPLVWWIVRRLIGMLNLESKVLNWKVSIEWFGDKFRWVSRGITTWATYMFSGWWIVWWAGAAILQHAFSHSLVNRFGNTWWTKLLMMIADIFISHYMGIWLDSLIDDNQDENTMQWKVMKWLNNNGEAFQSVFLKWDREEREMGISEKQKRQELENIRESWSPLSWIIDDLIALDTPVAEIDRIKWIANQYESLKSLAATSTNNMFKSSLDRFVKGNDNYGLNAQWKPLEDRLKLINLLLNNIGTDLTISQLELWLSKAFTQAKANGRYGNKLWEWMFIDEIDPTTETTTETSDQNTENQTYPLDNESTTSQDDQTQDNAPTSTPTMPTTPAAPSSSEQSWQNTKYGMLFDEYGNRIIEKDTTTPDQDNVTPDQDTQDLAAYYF